jgi:AraC family L-rhamnose operon regulatory protein RhaS
MFFTKGNGDYQGYILFLSVTDCLDDLKQEEAGEYYKIIYIKSGPCNFILNNKEFVLTGACAICMNESDTILFRKVSEEGIRILWFKPDVINSKLSIEVMNDKTQNLSTTEYQDMFYLNQFRKNSEASLKILSLHTMEVSGIDNKLQIMKEILINQETQFWPCRSRSYLMELLFGLTRQEEEEAYSSITSYEGNPRFVMDVIYHLQTFYNHKITLESLVEQFHTNRTTLLNEFKKTTGVSINRYLIELRLRMATMLLRDTKLSVDEISDRTGFHDVSYFSRIFKREISYTPSEYRKIYS